MELSHSLLDAVCKPKFVLSCSGPGETGRHSLASDPDSLALALDQPLAWSASPLNPQTRVHSLPSSTQWRIDGATACGTCFFAVPLSLPSGPPPPLGIFVMLPDQTTFPPALRLTLDVSASVVLRSGPAIANLGISRHICRALGHRCARDPSILARYPNLPFGSTIVFDNVSSGLSDMQVTVVPNHEFERQTLSVDALRRLWADAISPNAWPPDVDLLSLRLQRQAHDTVCLVNGPGLDGTAVFKSAVGSVDHLYHELRFLLAVPAHPHIMPRPLAVVTKRSAFGGKRGVVGFLLPYFPAGSLRDVLPARQRAGTLPARVKLKWCRQVASALVHIRQTTGAFYSDLRPDNVLLDPHDNLVLCDFEQRGNWHEWCAPEVLFRRYAKNLGAAAALSGAPPPPAHIVELLAGYDAPRPPGRAESPVEAFNPPWFLLPPAGQDKATVYALGLFIYTVFEGLSNPRQNLASRWPVEPDVEFPSVRHTPDDVMRLVRRCTHDAPEWAEQHGHAAAAAARPARVVRRGNRLYPEEGRGDHLDMPAGTAAVVVVMETARVWWEGEVARARAFLDSEEWRRQDFGAGRPLLEEVLRELDGIVPDDSHDDDGHLEFSADMG